MGTLIINLYIAGHVMSPAKIRSDVIKLSELSTKNQIITLSKAT